VVVQEKPTNALIFSVFKKHTLKYLKAPTCFGLRPSSGSIHSSLLIIILSLIISKELCMLPEDGRRPKHVGAFKYFSVCFLNTENINAFVGFSWKIEIEMHGSTMKIIGLWCLKTGC
jgi:hypothetical protein